MRHQLQNTLSIYIVVRPKISKIGHPSIINLLHVQDQFPQLVPSTSLAETMVRLYTCIQASCNAFMEKAQEIANNNFNTFYITDTCTPWSVRSVFGWHIPMQPTALKIRRWGITKGIYSSHFFKKGFQSFTKVQT